MCASWLTTNQKYSHALPVEVCHLVPQVAGGIMRQSLVSSCKSSDVAGHADNATRRKSGQAFSGSTLHTSMQHAADMYHDQF